MQILKTGLAIVAFVSVLGVGATRDSWAQTLQRPAVQLSDAAYDAKMDEIQALMKEADQADGKGNFKGAIATLEKALDECQTYLGEGPLMIVVLQFLEINYAQAGQFDKAEETGKRAVAISEIVYDDTNSRKITSIANLGTLYLRRGRLQEAEPLLVRAQKLAEAAADLNAPKYVYIMKNLVELYQRTGRKTQADALQKRLDTASPHSVP